MDGKVSILQKVVNFISVLLESWINSDSIGGELNLFDESDTSLTRFWWNISCVICLLLLMHLCYICVQLQTAEVQFTA